MLYKLSRIFPFEGVKLTTVILTPGACEGRVWGGVHYVASGRSAGSAGSAGVFQTSVSCTRNATLCIGDTEIAILCVQKI